VALTVEGRVAMTLPHDPRAERYPMAAASCPGSASREQHRERWRPTLISLAGDSETRSATPARAPLRPGAGRSTATRRRGNQLSLTFSSSSSLKREAALDPGH
jgi:hypothetical protein